MAYPIPIADPPTETSAIGPWAAARAAALLNRTALVCDGRPHRICEVELYLYAPWHADPFVHGASHQERSGGWYFHRAGASYRGGTFKGLDFSAGAPGVGCGWLIRSVEAADGRLIDGSCNVVDHLLAVAGEAAIGPLDSGSPRALDPSSRLHLVPLDGPDRPVWSTPRVGLTLKRAAEHPTMPGFIGRRLRFLTEPRRVKKGRIQTLAALLADGTSPARIQALTGSPRGAIERAAAAFASGRGRDPRAFVGRRLSSAELYAMYGCTMA